MCAIVEGTMHLGVKKFQLNVFIFFPSLPLHLFEFGILETSCFNCDICFSIGSPRHVGNR